MAKHPDDIRILVVTDDPSAPRQLEQMLGTDIEIRTAFADTSNAVSRTFEESRVDLVMIHVDTADPGLLETSVRHAREQAGFVPVIAVVDADDSRAALTVAALGAEGFISHSHPRQLKRLVLDQLESLQARRDAHMALQSLEDIEARYTLLLDSSSEAIAYLHEGLHIYANPAYLDLFGFDAFEDLEGLSMLDLFTAARDGQDLKKVLRALSRDDIPREAMLLNAHRQDGAEFKASVAFSPARYGGEYCAQMLVNEELTHADPALEEQLRQLKTRDMLTDLLNAASFVEELSARIEARPDPGGLAVMAFSLDRTGELIQKVGMGATDALVKQAAELLAAVVDDDVVLARLREHSFGLLVDSDNREQAEALARKIVEGCNGRIIEVRDTSLTVTASLGVAVAGSEVPDPELLIEQAGNALSEAQHAGGNSFVRYRPRVSGKEGEDDAIWTERLRHAIDHDEFTLVTSAITCMEDDSFLINDIETRLRAEDSDEVMLPSTYLPIAARVGMAPRLDIDMLQRLHLLARERSTDSDGQWLVPISMATIMNADAMPLLEKLVKDLPFSADRLIWGLHEPEVRDKVRQAQGFIERFGALENQFALCNVGVKANVEPLLHNLDIDFLRLAPEAVKDLGDNDKLRERLSTLASHAREHKVRIIAPRIEHTGDLATLWQFGVTLVQGDFVREAASA